MPLRPRLKPALVLALSLVPLAAVPVTAHASASGSDPGGGPSSAHRADPSFGPAARSSALATAQRGVASTATSLGLDGQQALKVRSVARDVDGAEHVHYDRTLAGLPVIGGDVVVHRSASGALDSTDWASTKALAVPSLASNLAGLRRPSGATPVVYAVHTAPRLAWQTRTTGTETDGTPIDDLVYTDATTGARLGVDHQVKKDTGTGNSLYSGTVPLTTTRSGSRWVLTDILRGNHSTYDANNSTSSSRGTLFSDTDNTWGNGTTSSRQSAAVDAAYGAAQTWDYFKATFGRNGIANDGRGAYSRVHYGSGYENAFWSDSCFCMTYGDGASTFRPLVSLDVAGHEMTHGITSRTAGLRYSGDAGGLNEATSDVFGTMVEFASNRPTDPGDYLIGEKIRKTSPGYLRRMDNPSADGRSVNCWTSSTGGLDPHYSSGVGNHLFYLLAEGTGAKTIGGVSHNSTSCNGTTISGIGRTAAAAVWYRALTTYWTSTTTYPAAANGQVSAARDLYGVGSSQCLATVAAWKAVAVTPTRTCS